MKYGSKARKGPDAALCPGVQPSGFMIFGKNAAEKPISVIRKKKLSSGAGHIPRDADAAKALVRKWFRTEKCLLDLSDDPAFCERGTLVLKKFYRSAGLYLAVFFCGNTFGSRGGKVPDGCLPEYFVRGAMPRGGSKGDLYETAAEIAEFLGCCAIIPVPGTEEKNNCQYFCVDDELFGAIVMLMSAFSHRCCNRKIGFNISDDGNGCPFVSVFCSGIRKNLMTPDGGDLIPEALTEISECEMIAVKNGVFFEGIREGNRLMAHFVPIRREASALGIKTASILSEEQKSFKE